MKYFIILYLFISIYSCDKTKNLEYITPFDTLYAKENIFRNNSDYYYYIYKNSKYDSLDRVLHFKLKEDSVYFIYDSLYYNIINPDDKESFLFTLNQNGQQNGDTIVFPQYLLFNIRFSNFFEGVFPPLSLTCTYLRKGFYVDSIAKDSVLYIVYSGLSTVEFGDDIFKYLILFWNKRKGFLGSAMYSKRLYSRHSMYRLKATLRKGFGRPIIMF